MTVFEDQGRAVEEWLAEEFPHALAIESNLGSSSAADAGEIPVKA